MEFNRILLLLPPCLLILWIVLVLNRFRRRGELSFLPLWISGLLLIVVEDLARMVYIAHPPEWVHALAHVVMLDSYFMAGICFLLTSIGPERFTPENRRYLALCAAPHIALLTLYGFGYRNTIVYFAIEVAALHLCLAMALHQHRRWTHLLCHLAVWLPLLGFTFGSHYRTTVYYSQFAIYLATAIGFWLTLPIKRHGRLIVVAGFSMWSLCFLMHPLVKAVWQNWSQVADGLWSLQRFVVTFGLLILALEELVELHEYDALHDTLTGLPNRRLFQASIEPLLARAKRNQSRVFLFTIDLNGFKKINDNLGHDAGDFLLQKIADRLRLMVRASDQVFRIGGDEFYLLLDDVCLAAEVEELDPEEHCQQRIERLICDVKMRVEQEPFLYALDGKTTPIEARMSIGSAVYPDEACTSLELCRVADQNMYADKRCM